MKFYAGYEHVDGRTKRGEMLYRKDGCVYTEKDSTYLVLATESEIEEAGLKGVGG